MTCSDRSRTHGIRTSALPHFRTSALPHFRTSALNYNGLNTLLIRVASFVFAQPSRIVTRIAATGLFALGALAASAMLPVDEARAQSATTTLSALTVDGETIMGVANDSTCTTGSPCAVTIGSDASVEVVATPSDNNAIIHEIIGEQANEVTVTYSVGDGGTRSIPGQHRVTFDNIASRLTITIRVNAENGMNLRRYTIVATDDTSPPTFGTETITAQRYTLNEVIDTLTLPTATDGRVPLTYSLTPDLPAGLTFTPASRQISGTPTANFAEDEFTLTATDTNLATAELMFDITVTAAPPPTSVVSFTANNPTIAEDGGSSTLTLTLNEPIPTGNPDLSFPYTITGTGITVNDITVDGTTPADLTSGTITVAAGSATGTLDITGMEDSDDEGDETMTITLDTPLPSNAAGTPLTPNVPAPQITITITEFAVESEEVKAEVETVATLVGAVQTGLTAGLVRSRFSVQPSSGVAGRDTPDANGATGGATTSLTLPDNPRDLADILGGLALEHTADADSGGQYAVWVRGQYTSMDGDPTLNGITVNYDGNSSGIGVGAEKSTGRYVAGVAVNWLATDLDISSSSDDTTLSKYEESLVMVAPYVSLRRGARTFWFSGGYGIGDADATLEEGEGKASADVEVSFASAGADFVLSERGKNRIIGGLSVLGTRKVVDPLNFAAADVVIPKITLNTFRAQGELTYSRTVQAGEGRVVRPYIGVATLHDAGDRINDDSHAMDLRGGVDFDGTRFDVSLEASTELLREDHESWSVSGSARYQFAPGGRGASLSLDGVGGDASDIGLEGGYGMAMRQVHRDALLTPFAGIRHGSESGEFSSGMRLAIGGDMDADLRAARAFGNDEDTLKLTFRRTF